MFKKIVSVILLVGVVVCSAQASTFYLATNNNYYASAENWWGPIPGPNDLAEIRIDCVVNTQVSAPGYFWIGVYAPATLTISGSGGFSTAFTNANYSFVGNGYDGTITLANNSTLDMSAPGSGLYLGNQNNPGGTGYLNVTGGGTAKFQSLKVGYNAKGVVNIVNGKVITYDLNIYNSFPDNKIFIGEFGSLQYSVSSDSYYPLDLEDAFNTFVADGRLCTSPDRQLKFDSGVVTSVPKGDLSCDCKINLGDFSILAQQWLTVGSGCPGETCADLIVDGMIDIKDVGVLAANWLDQIGNCYYLPFTWTADADVDAPSFLNYDIAASIAWDGDGLYTFDPRNLKVYKGTTIDNLTYQYTGVKDSSFNQPYGDDAYWLGGGLWVDPSTGKWYTLVEIEFRYVDLINDPANHFARCGLATSTDKGHTWHYEGDVLTGDNPQENKYFANNWKDLGEPFMNLFVNENDGYFYAVLTHVWNLSTGGNDSGTRIARSPIASKMAPGSWTKWYNGAWSQPGLGGHSSDIFPNTGVTYIGYSTYLGKYIAMGDRYVHWVGNMSQISVCDSMETQNWVPAQRFLEQDLPARLTSYHWAWDPTSGPHGSRDRIGQTFRLYTVADAGLAAKYIPITLGVGGTRNIGFPTFYPLVSVPDYNPEYDQDPSLYLPTTLRSDFSGGSSAGWSTGSGSGWSVTGLQTQGLSVPANTSVINTAAPSCASGTVWFTEQSDNADRKFTVYFRYVDSGSYAAITYDNGAIGWKTATASGTLVSIGTPFVAGSTHSFKISFDSSNRVTIIIDSGTTLSYSGIVSGLPVQSGKWGLGSGTSTTNLFDNAAIAPLP